MYIVSYYLPMQIFIICKSRRRISQWADTLLIMWLSLMEQVKIIYRLIGCNKKSIASLLWYSCKRCITWIKAWEASDTQTEEKLWNNWPVVFNVSKFLKSNKGWRTVPDWRRLKIQNKTCSSELDVFAVKSIIKTVTELRIWKLHDSNVSVLVFWFWDCIVVM